MDASASWLSTFRLRGGECGAEWVDIISLKNSMAVLRRYIIPEASTPIVRDLNSDLVPEK
jgi:hypothetical protein